jgi:hypothetical protein
VKLIFTILRRLHGMLYNYTQGHIFAKRTTVKSFLVLSMKSWIYKVHGSICLHIYNLHLWEVQVACAQYSIRHIKHFWSFIAEIVSVYVHDISFVLWKESIYYSGTDFFFFSFCLEDQCRLVFGRYSARIPVGIPTILTGISWRASDHPHKCRDSNLIRTW